MRHHTNIASVSIAQRGRGLYLCNGSEDKDGTEQWEAFSTLAKAKRWCADYLGVKRPRWEEKPATPERWASWYAQAEFEGDEIYEDEVD